MSRPPFTPSEADRVDVCLGSAVLPRAQRRTAGARVGTGKHRYLQRLVEVGREQALAEIEDSDVRAICEAIDLEGLPDPSTYAAEVAFAYDWTTDTARELGRGTDRDYSAITETEIPGQLDVVALVGADGAFVADWKPERMHLPKPTRFEQLRLGALMAARAYGRDQVVVEIIRPREDGPAWRERGTLEIWDLALVAEDTRRRAERVLEARAAYAAGTEPRLVTGEHCRYCNSVEFCPAQTTLLRRLASEDGAELEQRFFDALSPDTAAKAWHRIQAAKILLERLEGALETYALHNPIDIGDGRIYGPATQQSLTLNGSAVWRLFKERLGEAVDPWEAVDIKVVQKKVKELLGRLVTAAAKDDRLSATLWGIVNDGGRKAKKLSATAVWEALVNVLLAGGGGRRTSVEFVKLHRKKAEEGMGEDAA